jgi:GNAT superfamily N-acetyltransferase
VRTRHAAARALRCATHTVRPLRRDDGALLDAVLEGLSERSRYQRFHSPKPRLLAAERRRLTDVDDHDHLALIAFDEHGEPVGVARAVRQRDDPCAAELGVEIVDGRQHQGLGTELTERLARRAAAAGIERLIAHVLAESRLVGGLRRRGWSVVERDGPTVTFAIDAWRLARGLDSASATGDNRPERAIEAITA